MFADQSIWVFLFVTVLLGGSAAFLSGRALALRWRPLPHAWAYMILLAGAVRFLHFALFSETLLSLPYYLVDLVVLLAFAALGHRIARVRQMVTQYRWLYRRRGLLAWQPTGPSGGNGGKP